MDPEMQKLFDLMGSQAQGAAQSLAEVTGSGSDDDDFVTVKVDAGNRLVDLDFDPRSRRLDTHDLKERILTAASRASDACQAEVQRILEEQAQTVTGVQVPGIGDLQRQMQDAQAQLEEQKRRMEELASRFRDR